MCFTRQLSQRRFAVDSGILAAGRQNHSYTSGLTTEVAIPPFFHFPYAGKLGLGPDLSAF